LKPRGTSWGGVNGWLLKFAEHKKYRQLQRGNVQTSGSKGENHEKTHEENPKTNKRLCRCINAMGKNKRITGITWRMNPRTPLRQAKLEKVKCQG